MRGLCWIAAAIGLLAVGCDEELEPLCVPGETRACECPDGRVGAQWCNADGDAWACCHCDGSGDDDDDTVPTDDDDTIWTPTDDDDATDDDDDDDDDEWPALPSTMQIEVQFWAEGGTTGGEALVAFDVLFGDEDAQHLCTVGFEFEAVYSYGGGQGDDFWPYIDEVVTWTGGGEVANGCPPKWTLYHGDPVEEFRWGFHPMAFVSCDAMWADGTLDGYLLAEEAVMPLPVGDGTFADFCSTGGWEAQSAFGTGPVEGIWLTPGYEDQMDPLGEFGYFEPPSQAQVDVWLLMGLLMADASNTAEPLEGLEGDYVAIPLWVWAFG